MEKQYMEDIVKFLQDVEWIYDFQVTKIFTRDVFSQMPEDWKSCLVDLPLEVLNKIPQCEAQEDWPPSLQRFFSKCQEFSLQNIAEASITDSTTQIPQKYFKGLPEKKQHEVIHLFKLVERVVHQTGSNHVLDIGSGLGYVDSILHGLLKLCVVGAEGQEKLVNSAMEKHTRVHGSCGGIRHVHWRLTDDEETVERAQRELFEMTKMNIACTCTPQEYKKSSQLTQGCDVEGPSDELCQIERNSTQVSPILLGLHACADLSPVMLKIFKQCVQFSALVLLSCCYHKMTPEKEVLEECAADVRVGDDTRTPEDFNLPSPQDDHLERVCCFVNFPLSKTLKSIMSQQNINISIFGLRLASQESGLRWMKQTEETHEMHKNRVAYRGILEAYCEREHLKLTKLRRRCASKGSFSSFEDYLNCIFINYDFIPSNSCAAVQGSSVKENEHYPVDKEQVIFKENAMKILKECHDNYEYLFPLIEPLTGLQLALQPVMEALVLLDRVAFLKEAGFRNVSLQRVFDAELSPRNVSLIAVR